VTALRGRDRAGGLRWLEIVHGDSERTKCVTDRPGPFVSAGNDQQRAPGVVRQRARPRRESAHQAVPDRQRIRQRGLSTEDRLVKGLGELDNRQRIAARRPRQSISGGRRRVSADVLRDQLGD
jgi:hypothetical protein